MPSQGKRGSGASRLSTLGSQGTSSLWPGALVPHRQFQKAEDHFSAAIQHNPQEPQYYLYRAKSRRLLQDVFGARQDLATVLLLNPNQPKVGACLRPSPARRARFS